MSGQWPPEWDDSDDITEEADQQDAATEAGLSEVAAYLASVPAPVMPGSVEARISAALAVETAARSGIATPAAGDAQGNGTVRSEGPVQPAGATGARVLGPAPARARVRRGVSERRRERETRKIYKPRRQRDSREVLGKFVLGPLAVCLLLVIIVLGLSHGLSSSSSSGPSSGGVSGVVGAASSVPSASRAPGYSSAASGALAPVPASSAAASASSAAADFTVIQTGTSYQRATLAQQARAQVLAAQARESGQTAVPSASSATFSLSTPGSAVPGPLAGQLRACVLAVTGGVRPELVDRATYQGTPAYIIATSSHVWVTGLGCTAARPQVIASVPLAG